MKKNVNRSPVMIAMFVIFLIYAISILIVIIWGVNISLMSRKDYNQGKLFPTSLQFINYISSWTELQAIDMSMIEMTLNSLWYACGTSFFSVLFSCMTAYVIAKYNFFGRRFFYAYAVVTLMIPILGSSPSAIKFYDTLHIYDTQFLIFMFASAFGQNFIILFAVFKGVSWEYAESAFIDGANSFTVWYKIMLPQVVSPMVALFVVEFITLWGDGETALLFLPNHPSLASGLYIYKVINEKHLNTPALFAGLMICTVPVLLLYLFFQKSIMDIQLGGGLKG